MTDLQSRIAALTAQQRALLESRVADLAAESGAGSQDRIQPRAGTGPAPLSYAQQREWALERFRPSNNISGILRLDGEVDLDLLSRVLTEVMARHQVLRSTVEIGDRVPVQVVHPVTPVPVTVVDLSDLDPQRQRDELRRRYQAEEMRPFPPEQPHRIRGMALRLGPNEYAALTTIHHSSSDGWSMAIVLREVMALYAAFCAGQPSPLPPLPIQYADFAVWQREHLNDEWMARELAYWREVLAGIPPRLALPTDRPHPVRRTYAGAHHTMSLDRERMSALRRYAQSEGASISMIMLAVCSVVLHRYTGQDDLVFGSAITGRTRTETEPLIGCFANVLPLRMRVSRGQTLSEVLHQAQQVVAAAFDHQDLPFDRLVEELAPRETAQTPLIQMMINVLTAPGQVLRLPTQTIDMSGLRVTPVAMEPGPIPIDMILAVEAHDDTMHLQWHFSTELFDRESIVRLAAQADRVLDRLVTNPQCRVGEVDLRDTGRVEAPARSVARPAGGPGCVELFQRQVAAAPDAPAVVCSGEVTTFGELNRQADRLAHHLRGLGVGPEVTAGVLVGRSPELAVAVLAVLKAGGAYVPLDPQYPADRLTFMLTDSGAPVLITTEELAGLVAGAGLRQVLVDGPLDGPDGDLPDLPEPGAAAYVCYTSGSTGTPKGVVVEHGSLVTFAREAAARLQLGAGDRFLQFASPGFDVLAEELFPIWLSGGAVVIPPPPMLGPGIDLIELTRSERVTAMELPAAFWHQWAAHLHRTRTRLPGWLRLVIVGAERVLPDRLTMWQRTGIPLMHVYGITETTVSSTFFRLPAKPTDADLNHLPIGSPLPSVRLHILDSDLRPVPVGGVGELYLGGIGVARGYLRRPALTAERFVADPFTAGQRLYRSGDLVRQRADGNLEFVSRSDTQINIRGLRVEPAEIEGAICRHPQVAEAVVTVHEPAPDDRRLVAYLVPQPRTRPNITDLRRFLARELPPFLVPAAYVHLEALPLTENGKIDYDRLPEPGDERPELTEELVAPQTPLERQLAAIVADVLGVTTVGATDNFFDLGGDSILAIQVVARAQEQGIGLSPLDLFEHPTVTQLARAASDASPQRVVRPRSAQDEPVLSFDQERLWLEDQLVPGAAYNVGGRQRLLGPLDVATLQATLRAILVRHESLRSRFPTVDGRPVQVVDEVPADWRLPVVDLSTMDGDREAAALRLMDEQATVGFDLANGPLLRCLLIRLSATEHILNITSHHIVSDMLSMGLLAREMAALYQAGGDPVRADLPELPIQYLDYSVWQRGWLVGDELERQVGYWREHLAGAPPALALPSAQHQAQGAGGDRVRSRLPEADTAALHELCRAHGVTMFMVVLSTLATVLSRWSGQRDVVVGVSISTRTDAGAENLIGCFVNTLPLHVDLSGEPTFADLLARVREVAYGGYAHADAPLDLIVKQLQVTRDPRRTPLFQVMLNVVDLPTVEKVGELTLAPVDVPPLPSSFDLVLTTNEIRGGLNYVLEFNADRYQPPMMRILAGHLGAFLHEVAADPTRSILAYPLPPAATSAGTVAHPAPAPHLAVGRHAGPDRVAVVDQYGKWSYRWLAEAADRVAHLLAQRNADRVGVVRRPSAAFVAAVLGCGKAGTAYSVIEPAAGDSDLPAVLDVSPNGTVDSAVIDLSGALAEVTGTPDGRAAVSAESADWAVERFGLTGDDRFTVLSSSAGLLMSALSSAFHSGGTLVIPEASYARDTGALVSWLRSNAITVAYLSPPLLRAITSGAAQLPLRYAFVDNTGQLISHDVDALRRAAPACRCVAVYRTGADGRPLATYEVPEDWRLETAPLRVPLGSELDGVPTELRHPSGHPASIGEVAEICAGPDRTGDLGRRWADGGLEYVGRLGEGGTA